MVWVVFAVVVRFLVVGFGLLMIFLVGSDVWLDGFGFLGFFFFLWVLWPAVVLKGGGGGGFRYRVDLQWRMLWFFGFGS